MRDRRYGGRAESLPFLEAIRQLGNELGRDRAMYIHATLVPYLPAGRSRKLPTHSVKELLSVGIQPDLPLCRADRPIPESERRKIGLFCNICCEAVIQALDVATIYAVPISYHQECLDDEVLHHFWAARRPVSTGGAISSPASPARKARLPSASSASTPACSTPTSRWPKR